VNTGAIDHGESEIPLTLGRLGSVATCVRFWGSVVMTTCIAYSELKFSEIIDKWFTTSAQCTYTHTGWSEKRPELSHGVMQQSR